MAEAIRRWRTLEREYIEYGDRFVKRSLAPEEYTHDFCGDPSFFSSVNMQKLQNEAKCLDFVAKHTTVPVPKLLRAYKQHGSFVLETALVHGVLIGDLNLAKQQRIIPQVERYLQILHCLQSNTIGGPSGFIWPPPAIVIRPSSFRSWSQADYPTSNYVFCHRDASQANIYVDPMSPEVVAIGDWESGGFYPASHEVPFYKSPVPSGQQARTIPGMQEIRDFWSKKDR